MEIRNTGVKLMDKDDDTDDSVLRNQVETEFDGDLECSAENSEDLSTKKTRVPRSEKKRQRHLQLLAEKKEKRRNKKLERKERLRQEGRQQLEEDEERLSKRQIKEQIHSMLVQALADGQRVCVDLSMENSMTFKEKSKLAQQLGRLYGANRKCPSPVHVYLTGLNMDGELYAECVRKNEGFQNYLMDITEKCHTEIFDKEDIVYLTPDGESTLTAIDPSKVYVIGGLVDEQVNKNLTKQMASASGITTARLPISEYMEKVEQPSHSQVLAINQVFEILLMYMCTQDWRSALQQGVPKRKGYVLKQDPP